MVVWVRTSGYQHLPAVVAHPQSRESLWQDVRIQVRSSYVDLVILLPQIRVQAWKNSFKIKINKFDWDGWGWDEGVTLSGQPPLKAQPFCLSSQPVVSFFNLYFKVFLRHSPILQLGLFLWNPPDASCSATVTEDFPHALAGVAFPKSVVMVTKTEKRDSTGRLEEDGSFSWKSRGLKEVITAVCKDIRSHSRKRK